MLAIPLELESQINHLAECEHTDTTTLLSRMVSIYQSLNDNALTKLIEDYHDIKAADLAMLDPVTLSEAEAWSLIDDVEN